MKQAFDLFMRSSKPISNKVPIHYQFQHQLIPPPPHSIMETQFALHVEQIAPRPKLLYITQFSLKAYLVLPPHHPK